MDNSYLIICLVLASSIWWIVMPLRALLQDQRLRVLAALTLAPLPEWPRVSVLVPAKNEEDTLFDAVQSLLRVDYPDLEIILLDDRSTDLTGEIVDRLARLDSRVRPIHIEQLADGWLGKVHALHRGTLASSGEWLLFTDADIHFTAPILKKAIAYCTHNEKGFLALLPEMAGLKGPVGWAQAAFGILLLSMLNVNRIADPRSKAAMGVGAFNLVRKEHIDAQAGLEWLRMEIADDIGLGLMMKRRGVNADILSGRDLVSVDWYPSLAAMLDGVLQRCVMGSNYYLSLFAVNCAFMLLCVLAPLGLALALAPHSPFAWLCLGAYLVPAITLQAGVKNIGMARAAVWGIPIGHAIIIYGMLRSLFSCMRHGGVYWRGNVYPLRQLRALQRVKLSSFF